MPAKFFPIEEKIKYEGTSSKNILSFKHYDPMEIILGKTLKEHLRFAVCYWHNFVWNGSDPFGGVTFERPWFGDDLSMAKLKADVAFEMFELLDNPFFCFHDFDVRPEGNDFRENTKNLNIMADYIGKNFKRTS